MLHAHGDIDVIIPHGGRKLTQLVARESRVPTLLHLDGNCHSYIHAEADNAKAIRVITNAKMRRTGICGATESVLIDTTIANAVLPALVDALNQAGCADIRGCQASCAIDKHLTLATEKDWSTEYLDSIISIKIVSDSG